MHHPFMTWAAAALCCVSLQAQQDGIVKPVGEKAADAAVQSNWVTQCGGQSRQVVVGCSLQQSVIKTDTRQLVVMFSIRVPGDTRAPVMMVQLPLGVFIPGGVELQADTNTVVSLPLQTCDANGCYAGAPVSSEFAEQLKRGKTLRISFKDLSQTKLDIPMPLSGFPAAYDAIK
jgi:invasion protein IalB